MTLVGADVYRDGGSLEVRFLCEDGTFESIWLQAIPLDNTFTRFAHGPLRIAESAHGADTGDDVPRGSNGEREIISKLARFLDAPTVNLPFDQKSAEANQLQIVANLLNAIPHRVSS